MPRYVVRRGANSFDEMMKDAKSSFPTATKIDLTKVPNRRNEYIFKEHYKIAVTIPKKK